MTAEAKTPANPDDLREKACETTTLAEAEAEQVWESAMRSFG